MLHRDYKIYYNNSFVLITSERTQSNKNFTKVITDNKETKAFFSNSLQLFDGITNESILFISDKPDEAFSSLVKRTDKVIAGGGIVTNEDGKLLMMFRKNKWDLPKGKIEKDEKIADGAVREVEEETGVKIQRVKMQAIITYHAYRLKGKDCLKETSWFEMTALPGQKKLTPQTEEDIEEVRWVKKSDLKKYKEESYPLIWDLVSHYAE